jgi:pimeloyl-ACP methyl ester carboxylesterase
MQKKLNFKTSEINYTISGSGPTIVLLHGFVESLEIWNQLIPLLNKNYRIIAIDLPGHGKSQLPSIEITIDEMAQTVHEVIERENAVKVIMVGHSMGGYVTMAFADLFPEKLNGICLFHSSALADTEEKKVGRLRAVEAVKKDHKDFTVSLVSKLFKKGNEQKFSGDAARLKEIAKNTSSDAVIASLMAMRNRTDHSPALSKLKIPVLFIWGKTDKALDFETVFPQAKLPSLSQVLILDKAGHLGFIEAQRETFKTIENFAEFCASDQ